MPIIKSAKKRVKTAAKANVRNTRTRRDMREAIKAFNKALETGRSTEVSKLQNAAVSAIDTAAKKNVIHKNKAARSKARLASRAKLAGIKPAKAPAKKPAAKKPVTKKTTKK
jgi:small subunit ribosomal protein S20